MSYTLDKCPSEYGAIINDEMQYYPAWDIRINGAELAEEYPQFGLTPEQVRRAVYSAGDELNAEIERVLRKYLAKAFEKSRSCRKRVTASVDLEQEDDYGYIYTADTVRYDCSIVLDAFRLDELPSECDGFADGWCNFGDDLFYESVCLSLIDDWDGPFTFHIDDWREYDRYIADRVRHEYGHELREA